jgi:2',3'-cyclic-nucleotide 2'-phosphodiesterase (5'-nucleotidase family)
MALSSGVATAGWIDTLKTDVELHTKDMGAKDNVLGHVVADAIRRAAKADFAFIAASYFAPEIKIPRGQTTTEEVLKALEYRTDGVLIVKLTGSQIARALEHGLSLFPKSNSGFLQVSGLVVTIAPQAEAEKHVLSVKAEGAALDPNRTYRVAMPAPLANGALAYFRIWKKSDIEKESAKEMEKVTLESALSDYLRQNKTIDKGEERIIVKEK